MTNARTAPRRGSRGYAWSLRPRLAGPVLAPAVGGLVGSLLVLVTAGRAATVPGATPPSRWWGLLAPVHGDWMPGLVPLALIAGVSLLLGSWLRLVQLAKHGQLSIPAVGAVAVLWALPLLLGPPLLSLDAYSYAAQGELLRAGGDPYRVGPEALGGGSALAAVDPFWRSARAPYGPLALLTARLATSLGNPVAALLALHLVAALALVLVAVAVCDLSPAHRRPLVLVLAVANPLILLQLLAAAHWEALMVAGLVAALALWRRQHPLAAVAMASVATAVKPPAALAVLVLAAAHVVAVPAIGQRVRATGKVVAAAALPWVLLAPLVPNAAGFLPALSTPLAGRTLYAPTTLLAEIIAVLGHVLGVPVHFDGLLAGTRVLGLALAAVVTAGLLLTWRRRSPAETIGGGLLVVALLGPVLYPWYLSWGLLPLVVAGRRWDWPVTALSAAAVFTALPGCQQLSVFLPVVRPHPGTTFTAATLLAVGVAVLVIRAGGGTRAALVRTGSVEENEAAPSVPRATARR
jgi:alpha-1,6-mannosyltransferase